MPPESSPAGPRRDDAEPRVPADFADALSAFARHDAAAARHLALLERLRVAHHEHDELRADMDQLLEHNLRATAELRELREVVGRYTRALKASGLPPERALVLVRTAVSTIVDALPYTERPTDITGLASDLVQSAIEAYYAA